MWLRRDYYAIVAIAEGHRLAVEPSWTLLRARTALQAAPISDRWGDLLGDHDDPIDEDGQDLAP